MVRGGFSTAFYPVSEDSDSKQVELDGFGDQRKKYRRTGSVASHCLDNIQSASSFKDPHVKGFPDIWIAGAGTLNLSLNDICHPIVFITAAAGQSRLDLFLPENRVPSGIYQEFINNLLRHLRLRQLS